MSIQIYLHCMRPFMPNRFQATIELIIKSTKSASRANPPRLSSGETSSVIAGLKDNPECSIQFLANLLEKDMGIGQKQLIDTFGYILPPVHKRKNQRFKS